MCTLTRKLLIAGNWKLNNTIVQSAELVKDLLKINCETHKIDIVVAPTFTAIKVVNDLLSKSSIKVAAQNAHWEENGAFTGEVSPQMVKEVGGQWVIIGHSERRQFFGEVEETVNKKVAACIKSDLKVILCIGESLEERQSGNTFDVLDRQLLGGLVGLDDNDMASIVIAYEPIWAIGTGNTASSEQAEEVHCYIREKLIGMYNQSVADLTRILYGGSVKPNNAGELLSKPNVDGALVGGASLLASDFCKIIDAALESIN
ncbi:MAG TPA: triose-phosphate isomerase [Nitrospinota bacterium]|nr:triose-phosphate isomerase [Nitrospinota bacterium]|tara:strand:+ start:101613 stop:102392 length:780 start_codon:yes stop_codon:yes gene_type:complete